MDNYTIFTKTAKGLGEALGKTKNLSREQRKILKEIDGKASLGDLLTQIGMDESKLQAAISQLLTDDYIREFGSAAPADGGSSGDTVFGLTKPARIEAANSQLTIGDFLRAMEQPQSPGASLDFRNLSQPDAAAAQIARAKEAAQVEETRRAIEEEARRITLQAQQQAAEAARHQAGEQARLEAAARAKQQAQDQARREAEERSRKEAEQQARIKAEQEARRAAEEAERQAQERAEEEARLAAEARVREEAEAQVRSAAAEQARKLAEAQAKREAQERARIKAREAARRVAEELAQREAQAQARAEAERQARARIEEETRLAAEEQARREAEEHARRLAEEQAQREAGEQMRLRAEEQARLAAEEKARREAEAQAKKAEQERARKETEEVAHIKAEEKARLKAEEKARKEAEAKVRQEAREQAKREAEEKARREAEQKAQLAAEVKARKEAEAQARRAAKEQERQAAAEAARLKAEEAVRLKAEKAAEKAAQKQVQQEASQETGCEEIAAAPAAGGGKRLVLPANFGTLVRLGALALVVLAVTTLGVLHVIPFNGRLAQLEQVASAQFGQPVKIGSLNLALFPRPHWRLQQVVIGSEGQIAVPQVNAGAELGSLLSESLQFQSLALLSPTVNDEGLGWLLFGQSQNSAWQLASLSASGVQLRSQHARLPVFNADAEIGANGGWRKIVLDATAEKIRLELQRTDGALRFELTARELVLPFGGALAFDTFNASGTVRPGVLDVSKFTGVLYDGTVSGTGVLGWKDGWSLKGEAQARQLDAAKLMPALLQGGALDGNFRYAMQAGEAGKLFAAPQARGSFSIGNTVLLGVDMASLVMGQAGSGKSSFNEVSGDFALADGKTQLSRMRLAAGLLSAAGDAAADPNGKLNGQFTVDLRTASRQARTSLSVSGTLAAPKFSR